MKTVLIALAALVATGAVAKESVCAKWEFGEPEELKKCLAQQATAKAFIQEYMNRYNMRSSIQAEQALRQGRGAALLFSECARLGTVGGVEDLAEVASCLKYREAQEKAAGTDLTK